MSKLDAGAVMRLAEGLADELDVIEREAQDAELSADQIGSQAHAQDADQARSYYARAQRGLRAIGARLDAANAKLDQLREELK